MNINQLQILNFKAVKQDKRSNTNLHTKTRFLNESETKEHQSLDLRLRGEREYVCERVSDNKPKSQKNYGLKNTTLMWQTGGTE